MRSESMDDCRNTPPSRRTSRSAWTLVEFLVAIAVIGLLVSLLLPAVQRARETARRTQCQNRLRQLGVGLLHFHDAHAAFPIGCSQWRPWGNTTNRQLAWSARLLPYVEQESLYERLDLQQPYDAPANASAAAVVLPVFLCPTAADPTGRRATGRGASHFGGMFGERITGPNQPPKGVMLLDRAVSLPEVTDGAPFTLIVAEDSQFPDGEWINGRNIFDQAYPLNQAPAMENDIRSDHPGGANAVTCGASVRFLTNEIDSTVVAALCTRAGNELLGDAQ